MGCPLNEKPAVKAPTAAPAKGDKVAEAFAKLSSEDRKLAEQQKFCAVENESPLGGMGTPFKLVLEGQTVFLCCEGCKEEALKDQDKTLANAEKLRMANK